MKQVQKTYNNYVYLTLNKLLFSDTKNYYELKLKTSVLKDGLIINKEEFINEYFSFLKKNKISRFLWNKRILIIYSANYSYHDKKLTKYIFEELGYKNADLIHEINMLSLTKKDAYLLKEDVLKLYYIDKYNKKNKLELNMQLLDSKEIETLLKNRCKDKNILLINHDDKIAELVSKLKLNYYYTTFIQEFFQKNLKN